MTKQNSLDLIQYTQIDNELKNIAQKVFNNQRITQEEGVLLYQKGDLAFLGLLADHVRTRFNDNIVTFNRNFHIEPTNICSKSCHFCSYKRRIGGKGAWEKDIEEIREVIRGYKKSKTTEVHITGGVHPNKSFDYYINIIKAIKEEMPLIHVKAFSAVEIEDMLKRANLSVVEGLKQLKEAGLGSIPGGGAEIFDEKIREQISPDKATSKEWLEIHKEAHNLGMKTNATMLYGLIENYEHRIEHMNRLRELQDITGGFNTFIPLKFRRANNNFSHVEETTTLEDLKNYAVSRIFLDNIPHIKAYWPMIGKKTAQLSLAFGVDDLDGTVDDSTKIYSMAGAEDQNPKASSSELIQLIRSANRTPAERDTLFNIIEKFENE